MDEQKRAPGRCSQNLLPGDLFVLVREARKDLGQERFYPIETLIHGIEAFICRVNALIKFLAEKVPPGLLLCAHAAI